MSKNVVTTYTCDINACVNIVLDRHAQVDITAVNLLDYDGQYMKSRKDPDLWTRKIDLCERHRSQYIESLPFTIKDDGIGGFIIEETTNV